MIEKCENCKYLTKGTYCSRLNWNRNPGAERCAYFEDVRK